jgi:hypothetical protein
VQVRVQVRVQASHYFQHHRVINLILCSSCIIENMECTDFRLCFCFRCVVCEQETVQQERARCVELQTELLSKVCTCWRCACIASASSNLQHCTLLCGVEPVLYCGTQT